MKDFCAIDFETADPKRDSACAVGLVRVHGCEIVARESALIRPPRDGMHPACQAVHGIRWFEVSKKPRFADVWKTVSPILEGIEVLVAHNVAFDRAVLVACCEAADLSVPDCHWVCTLEMCRAKWPKPHSNKLSDVCARLNIPFVNHHHALADAEACAKVLIALEGRKPFELPPPEPPVPVFVPTGEAGAILAEIPVEHRTSTVVRLMCDAQTLGPRHAADLVKCVRQRFGTPEPKIEIGGDE